MNRNLFYLFFILIFVCESVDAQKLSDDEFPVFNIKYVPTTLMHRDEPAIQIAAENYISEKVSLQYEIGVFSTKYINPLGNPNDGLGGRVRLELKKNTHLYPFKNSINYIGIGSQFQQHFSIVPTLVCIDFPVCITQISLPIKWGAASDAYFLLVGWQQYLSNHLFIEVTPALGVERVRHYPVESQNFNFTGLAYSKTSIWGDISIKLGYSFW